MTTASATKWIVDPTHSEIGFKVKHMMFTNVSGKFDKFSISAEVGSDDFENAKVSFEAETASINTGNEQRDGHLKSPEFFNAEANPTLSFHSTSFTKSEGNHYVLTGDLHMNGVSHPVTLNVEFGGMMKDPWGNMKAAFAVSGKISRKDWQLNWNAPLETGGLLVSDEVNLHAELQFVKEA